jgi:hypothetical protein
MSRQFKQIDEIYKNVFSKEEVSPPANAWTNIQQNIPSPVPVIPPAPFVSLYTGFFHAITAIVVITGTFFVAAPAIDRLNTHDAQATANMSVQNQQRILTAIENGFSRIDAAEIKQAEAAEAFPSAALLIDEASENIPVATNIVHLVADDNIVGNLFFTEEVHTPIALQHEMIPAIINEYYALPADLERMHSVADKKKIPYQFNSYLSLNYGPEWQEKGMKPYNFANGAGFSGGISWKNLFVETGVQYRTEFDYGVAQITNTDIFKTGEYETLDSLTLIIVFDPINYLIIIKPIFHTSLHEEFDTIVKKEQQQLWQETSYLHVPLRAGFRKDFGRVSFSLKGGLDLGMCIGQKSNQVNTPEVGESVIDYAAPLPDRKPFYTSMTVSPGMSFALNEHFSLSAEPTLRKQITSPYSDNRKGTTAYGLRAGITYHFW